MRVFRKIRCAQRIENERLCSSSSEPGRYVRTAELDCVSSFHSNIVVLENWNTAVLWERKHPVSEVQRWRHWWDGSATKLTEKRYQEWTPPPDVEQCLLSDKQFQLQLYTHVSWLWVRAISPQTWMTDIAAVGQMWPMGHIYLFI